MYPACSFSPDGFNRHIHVDERRRRGYCIVFNLFTRAGGDATLLSTPATTPESTKVHRQTTTKAGHIAGVVVAILLIIAIVMIVVSIEDVLC